MSNVEPLRSAGLKSHDEGVTATADPVFPGVNAAITYPIGERGGGIHLSTMFLRDDPGLDQEKILAKTMSVCAVVGLRENLIVHERERGNAERRLSELASDPEKKKALEAEIQTSLTEAATAKESAEKEFRESGRTGPFKLVGVAKNVVDAAVRDVEKKRKEIADLDKDLDRKREELRKAITNYGVAISNVEREIAIRREAYGE